MPRVIVFASLFALAQLGGPATAWAQQPIDVRTPTDTTFEFSTHPQHIPSVGLAYYLPLDAGQERTSAGDRTSVRITPQDQTWMIDIDTPATTDQTLTPNAVADKILEDLTKAYGVIDAQDRDNAAPKTVDSKAVLLERIPDLQIAGLPADRFYIAIPMGNGRSLMTGVTVFSPTPGRFVVTQLRAENPAFDTAKLVYVGFMQRFTLTDPNAQQAERGSAIERGILALSQLTEEDLDAVLVANSDVWYRLYEPSSTGSASDALEHGYRRVRAHRGHRGELTPKKASRNWNAAERQEGYILQIDARLLVRDEIRGDMTAMIDSQAVYFMSLDRREESWSIRMARKAGADTQVATETGVRDGTTMSVAGETGTLQPTVPDRGYVSQFEFFLMPQLLARVGIEETFAFYAYQSSFTNVGLRTDRLARSPQRPDVWVDTTTYREGGQEFVTRLNAEGTVISSALPDNRVWEPIGLDRLVRVWKSKGLPTD